MNYKITFQFLFLFLFSGLVFGQISYQGPASGSVPSGVMMTTDDFSKVLPLNDPKERKVRNLPDPVYNEDIGNLIPAAAPDGTNYFEDPNANVSSKGGGEQTLLLQDFAGISMTNSIPPDPHIAVGPNHVLATVNSQFAIWDKEGNLIKNINADNWYSSVLGAPGAFDPQIIYDHYSDRWFMLWDSQDDNLQRAHFLISISDDDDPTGIWYNYALPANVMGSDTVNHWGDYPQIGFDDEAIYINSRQFFFGGGKVYDRIRILNKAEYYAATGGPVTWTDIYDITYPGSAARPDVIHPVIMYSTASEYYFLHGLRTGGNMVTLYRLTNPLTSPVLTGVNVPTTSYSMAPNANQLGGGSPLIESNGSHIKTAPVYRDGFIWYSHSVRHPATITSASLRYGKINVSTNTVVEEATFGAIDQWYIYPTITVDKDQNIAISYTRTSLTEYAGAFYTTRLASDPPGLTGSTLLKEGAGNYVVTFGGTRNRWGDYLGIYLDPVTESNIWMLTEYAAATNTWGTWIGEIRLVPYPGAHIFTSSSSLEFGNVEINFMSDTLNLVIANYGEDQLNITSIPDSVGPFKLLTPLSFPINLNSYDSLTVEFYFAPTITGEYENTLNITSNDPNFTGVTLKGKGYEINPVDVNTLYAASGLNNSGAMLTINTTTGSGTILGPSLFNEVKSITIHPVTKVMYGLITTSTEAQIIRVNAEAGDSYNLFTLPVGLMQGIAFDTLGNMYGMTRVGEVYQIDLENKAAALLSNSAPVTSITFNPLTNELWASAFVIAGSNRDLVFKVDPATGDTTVIGHTGINNYNNGITFDRDGNLFGVTGTGSAVNNFISINTSTGEGAVIGSVGFQTVTGLAFLLGNPVSVEDDEISSIPDEFKLLHNYPNPFNPSTTIGFTLPAASFVKLSIYNILGEVVDVLINKQLGPGVHTVNWNSTDRSGMKLGSGVYFYELKASGSNGTEFTEMKKMILLK